MLWFYFWTFHNNSFWFKEGFNSEWCYAHWPYLLANSFCKRCAPAFQWPPTDKPATSSVISPKTCICKPYAFCDERPSTLATTRTPPETSSNHKVPEQPGQLSVGVKLVTSLEGLVPWEAVFVSSFVRPMTPKPILPPVGD